MQYKPFWERIFFLAVILHFIFFAGLFACGKFSLPKTEKVDEIEELEWIEVEVSDDEKISEVEPEIPEVTKTFPEIKILSNLKTFQKKLKLLKIRATN